jgi:hypothetical protein
LYSSEYSDATVFRDINGDHQQSPDETPVTTDARGRFPRPKGHGRLYLSGGIEILTGRPNTLLDEPGLGWREYPEKSFLDFGGGEVRRVTDSAATGAVRWA